MPGATETMQWGNDLLFKVGEKTFVFSGLNPPHSFSVKCSDDDFYAMIERDELKPAEYIGRFKWIAVPSLTHLTDAEVKSLVKKSYDLIFAKLPKSVRSKIGKS